MKREESQTSRSNNMGTSLWNIIFTSVLKNIIPTSTLLFTFLLSRWKRWCIKLL